MTVEELIEALRLYPTHHKVGVVASCDDADAGLVGDVDAMLEVVEPGLVGYMPGVVLRCYDACAFNVRPIGSRARWPRSKQARHVRLTSMREKP